MEKILTNPEKLTPRLLFQLYTHNYERTLFEKLLHDKLDDALRVISRDNVRNIRRGTPSLSCFSAHHINLDTFVELLNILDEILLHDESRHSYRRCWQPDEPIRSVYVMRELIMWCCVFGRFDLLDDILDSANAMPNKAEKGELFMENTSIRIFMGHPDAPVSRHIGMGAKLGCAFLLKNASLRCQTKYVLPAMLSEYSEQASKYEEDAVAILQACYQQNYDYSLLLIRWRHVLWGNRTLLEMAEGSSCEKLMAHDAVQDLLDRVWFGGVEPCSSSWKVFVCFVFPFLVPLLMTPSKDKLIDRVSFWQSGYCYGLCNDESSDPKKDFPPFHLIINFVLSPVFCFYLDLVSYLAFLSLFAYVLLVRVCVRITFYEYVLMGWLIGIQLERIRKFISLSNKTKKEKQRAILSDKWNWLYFLSILTFAAGLILRVWSTMTYKDIFINNLRATRMANLPVYSGQVVTGEDVLYEDLNEEWERFKSEQNFTFFESFISNSQNPVYNKLSSEYQELIKNNSNINVPNFINALDDTNGNYCPTRILGNSMMSQSSLLKWAQIFYGVTFSLMSLAVLHFYDVHRLLGPLAISIALMMKDLSQFILILAVFLVPYGVTTTALLYPNEVRFSEGMQGIFFKPILTLYGELFLSEYTAYDFNDPLGGCAKQLDIRKDLKMSPTYNGYDFVHETKFYKNMTKEWNQKLRHYDISDCENNDDLIVSLAAYYMVNYNCKVIAGQIQCMFANTAKNGTSNTESYTLNEIFESECFDNIKLVSVERPQNGYPTQADFRDVTQGPCQETNVKNKPNRYEPITTLRPIFNASMPNCHATDCISFSKRHHAVIFGSVLAYAFDTRRSDLIGSTKNWTSLREIDLSELVTAYFKDTDLDVLNYDGGRLMRSGDREMINETLYQGLISSKALNLLFEKNFNRCPEAYPITSILLGLYMLAANVMLVNLLVALFATTYDSVQENSESIWKLNRYDLVIEYWGKTPISCTPLVMLEHFMLLIKRQLFCGLTTAEENKITCWPRSPGDHALSLGTYQFPIRGFNDTAADFDKTILKLIEFEQAQIEKLKSSQPKNDHLDEINSALATLDNDLDELSHAMQAFDEKSSL